MAVLIIWYGDLPEKVFWLVERTRAPWGPLALVAFLLVSVVPVGLLTFARVRQSGVALRAIGAIILAGLFVYLAVLIAPPFGAWSVPVAGLALVAMLGLAIGAASTLPRLLNRRSWGTADA